MGTAGGVLPSHRMLLRGAIPSEAGPGSPSGAGVGGEWRGLQGSGDGGGDGYDPPCGPGRSHAGPSLVIPSQNAASQPIRARFLLISWKLSQNGQVSPLFV